MTSTSALGSTNPPGTGRGPSRGLRAVGGALGLVLAALGLVLAGLLAGLCAVLLHGDWWGLLLGLATTVAVLVALGGPRWTRPAFAVGWVTVLVAAMLPRAEGDYLIASTLGGYLLLATVPLWVVAGLLALAGPRRGGRVAQDQGGLDQPT